MLREKRHPVSSGFQKFSVESEQVHHVAVRFGFFDSSVILRKCTASGSEIFQAIPLSFENNNHKSNGQVLVFIFKKLPDGCVVVPCAERESEAAGPPLLRPWVWLVWGFTGLAASRAPASALPRSAGPRVCEATGGFRAGLPRSAGGVRPALSGRACVAVTPASWPPAAAPVARPARSGLGARWIVSPSRPCVSNFTVVSSISFSVWARALSQGNALAARGRAWKRE